jgi:hypothetical protein
MNNPPGALRHSLVTGVCLVAIAASALWIWRVQFSGAKQHLALHQSLGRIMAEETSRLMNSTGRVVLITIDEAGEPELKAQHDAFHGTLARRFPQIHIKKIYKVESEDKKKYSFGAGLSGRRYVRIVNKNLSADAIVSFIGAPGLNDEEITQLKKVPPFLAESRSAGKLKPLFEKKLIHAAITTRFQFPTPVKGAPRTPQEWFDQRFQIVTPDNARDLPDAKGE